MIQINYDSPYLELNVCNCEHTLSYAYRKMRCFSVQYKHTKGKAGAYIWKKK
mgnify:CR=1 FL=1